MSTSKLALIAFALMLSSVSVQAEETIATPDQNARQLPQFKLLRAEENWRFLREEIENSDDPWINIKNLKFANGSKIQMWIGGEARVRGELYENRNWQSDSDQKFWSQRLALHSNLQVNDNFRVFGEIFHGYVTGKEQFAESDEIGIHQGFAEFSLLSSEGSYWHTRLGRQELAFGSARLFGIREGPNVRRSFDAIRSIYVNGDLNISAFYGREVTPGFGAFDNSSNLFANGANNPEAWGLYSQFDLNALPGKSELYYLGFKTNSSQFNDTVGAETRHSIGLRRFGGIGERFEYNTEFTYQFGELGAVDINAFNFDLDWSYRLDSLKPGFRLEWSSGDDEAGDNEINSYNPMFVNPEYYGLSKIITPSNVISIRPYVSFDVSNKINVYVEFAQFWRESSSDGLYRVTRFLARPALAGQSRDLGRQIGMKVKYGINRHWSMDLDVSYFSAGQFISQSGENEDIFHIAPTLRFRF